MTDLWTTSYLAALAGPDQMLPFLPPSRAFSAQTVRQSVRLRRGATAVRLVLSNEFGRTPLVIDELTVGNSDAGPARPALRHGRARWEIPAGRTATSDPVPLSVAAGAELTVSGFVAGQARPATYLHSAQRTGEVAPGNQLGRWHLTDADRFTSLYWVAQVLVDAPPGGPVIIAFGDSITRGDGTTADRDQRYPDHLQRRLLGGPIAVPGAVVLNAGLGGNRLLRPRAGPSMLERFDRDVLGVAEATHLLLLAGVNDLATPGERAVAREVVDGLVTLAGRAQQRGIQAVLGTITPFGGSVYEAFRAEGNEQARQAVNDALTTQRDWPVVDFAAAVADPGNPTRLAAAFDSGDGVHPGDAGARALAEAVDPALFTAPVTAAW